MKINYTAALSMFAGAALGGAAGSKDCTLRPSRKLMLWSELETLDPAAQAAFTPLAKTADASDGR